MLSKVMALSMLKAAMDIFMFASLSNLTVKGIIEIMMIMIMRVVEKEREFTNGGRVQLYISVFSKKVLKWLLSMNSLLV